MAEWLNAIVFGIFVVALVFGLTYTVMGITTDSKAATVMQQRVENYFFGVSGLVIAFVLAFFI